MMEYNEDIGKALVKAVDATLRDKIRDIVEQEAVAAGVRATQRVRELAVETCAHMRSKMDINFHNSRELHIKLTLDDKTQCGGSSSSLSSR